MLKHIQLFLKGMAMGAADVVPGVSGGTIAFHYWYLRATHWRDIVHQQANAIDAL
jgi:uncharacterized membrane protein